MSDCPTCGQRLREIDRYVTRLSGCLSCNAWDDAGAVIALPKIDVKQ